MRCCTRQQRHSIQIQITHTHNRFRFFVFFLSFSRTIFVVSIYSILLCMCFVFVYVVSLAFVLCAMMSVLFRHLRRGSRIFQYFLEWKSPPPERRENPDENKTTTKNVPNDREHFQYSASNGSQGAICSFFFIYKLRTIARQHIKFIGQPHNCLHNNNEGVFESSIYWFDENCSSWTITAFNFQIETA